MSTPAPPTPESITDINTESAPIHPLNSTIILIPPTATLVDGNVLQTTEATALNLDSTVVIPSNIPSTTHETQHIDLNNDDINAENNSSPALKPPDYGSLPPDYLTATELPSYEEAERIKREGGEFLPPTITPNGNTSANANNQFPSLLIFSDLEGNTPIGGFNTNNAAQGNNGPNNREMDFFDVILGTQSGLNRSRSTGDEGIGGTTERNPPASSRYSTFPLSMVFQEWRHNTSDVIGSDTAFLTSFLISFIFNWIGFLFALCVSQTIAGRCGALSGFGLSIIKWTFIVKHSLNYASAEIWLWWILIILGALLFCKGCIQYLQSRPFGIRQ